MGTEGLLPQSHAPANCPYPGPDITYQQHTQYPAKGKTYDSSSVDMCATGTSCLYTVIMKDGYRQLKTQGFYCTSHNR
jgi:hypothetical protein